MPIYIGNSINRRKIRIKSAGKPQYFAGAACTPTVFLQATLNDTKNLRNHSFEWDFLENTPPTPIEDYGVDPGVTLVSVGGASPIAETRWTYDSPNKDNDQNFRFYIDRGTYREQYADTKVYWSPTSLSHPVVSSGNYGEINSTIPNLSQQPDIFPLPYGVFEPLVKGTKGVRLTFDKTSLAVLTGNQTSLEVLYSATNGLVLDDVFATYTAEEWPNGITVPVGSYRIRVYYQIQGKRKVFYTSPKFAAINSSEGDLFASHAIFANLASNSGLVNLIRIVAQRETYFDLMKLGFFGVEQASSINRFKFQAITTNKVPGLLVNFYSAFSSNGNLVANSLVRIAYQDIGN